MRDRLAGIGSCLLLGAGIATCSGPPAPGPTSPAPASQPMPDGKWWTVANLSVQGPASYCYDGNGSICRHYGRLYTWEAARLMCRSLGPAWRLPSMEEWKTLAKVYGGVSGDGLDSGKTAFRELLAGGRSGLALLLGGGGDPRRREYTRLEAHGFYWSASEESDTTACYLNFGKGSLTLYDQDGGEKTRAFSVRCVADSPGQ